MTKSLRLTALAWAAVFTVAACGSATSPTTAPSPAPPSTAASEAPATPSPTPTIDPNSLLGKIIAAGKIRISTDPNYAPFSSLDVATGKYVGFDTSTAE